MKFWFVITIYLVLYYKTARAHIECAPTVGNEAVYFFASFPAINPDRQLIASTSTSSTTAVP